MSQVPVPTLADIQAQIAAGNIPIDPVEFSQAVLLLLNAIRAASGGGGGITQLTGDVTAGPGTGSQAATVAAIQGVAISGSAAAGKVLEASSPSAASWQTPATGIGGTLGATANAIPRANGTGGSTLKAGLAIQNDDGSITLPGGNFVDLVNSLLGSSGGIRLFNAFAGAFGANTVNITNGDNSAAIVFSPGRIRIPALPTSSAGLSSGELYTTAGAVMQVP